LGLPIGSYVSFPGIFMLSTADTFIYRCGLTLPLRPWKIVSPRSI